MYSECIFHKPPPPGPSRLQRSLDLNTSAHKLPALAIILHVAFLSPTSMLTAFTSSLHNIKLKLNACSVPRSELVESPSCRPIHCLSRWRRICGSLRKYAEIVYNDFTARPLSYLYSARVKVQQSVQTSGSQPKFAVCRITTAFGPWQSNIGFLHRISWDTYQLPMKAANP